MKTKGIAFRLASVTLLFCSLIFVAIVGYNYSVSKNIIEELAENRGTLLASATAEKVTAILHSVQKVTDSVAFSLETETLSKERLFRLSRRVITENPGIYGTAIAFEPYFISKDKEYYAPYYYRLDNEIYFSFLGGEKYQYFYMDWYQLAKELEKPIWTEPYYDTGGGGALMTTYSVPLYRNMKGEKKVAGVVTADISLAWIQEHLAELSNNESGYVFLLSRYGSYISHPNSQLVMNETIFTHAENQNYPMLREVGHRMLSGEKGVEILEDLPLTGDSFLYFAPFPDQEWSIGVVFPKEEILAKVSRLNRNVLFFGGIGFTALTLLLISIAVKITDPLRRLNTTVNQIADGNLDAEIELVTSGDEVGELSESFKSMQDSLKRYISNLTETTAVKERIESELRIAHDIQMGILPKLFPAFPERSEFDIYATIESAREVGGDLYDFFFLDEDRFCIVVGDVSGKGVPAAFFMAVTKTLLKVIAEGGLEPGKVLTKVNNDLAEDNDACMFVTLFLAVVDINSGEVHYASAGHNPPLFIPKGRTADWLPPLNEPVAGAMEGIPYTTRSMIMEPGDTLFVYTDGVTEAMDSSQTLYSEERLLEKVNQAGQLSATELVKVIDTSIKEFTGGAEQSDDITMLALQYLGKTQS